MPKQPRSETSEAGFMEEQLRLFLVESNLIEGITRPPTQAEIQTAKLLLGIHRIDIAALSAFQEICAPGHPLRDEPGMDVTVGCYTAPPGGPNIRRRLEIILASASSPPVVHPWHTHTRFELLHPYLDGNGRSGRMLWLWQMHRLGKHPDDFLRTFYYQTLEHA